MQSWFTIKLTVISLVSLYLLYRALKLIRELRSEHVEIKALSENIQKMANIGGWQVDLATQKTTWTKQTYQIHDLPFNTSTSVAMGIQFYFGEDQEKITRAVQDCAQGKSFREVLRFTSATGIQKWVECVGEPIFDNQNGVVKLRGTIQDVTSAVELKLNAEQEHLEAERLRKQNLMILNHSPVAVYECENNQNWTMKYMSAFIEKLTGYSPTDFIEDQVPSYASIVHPEDRLFVERTIRKAIDHKKPFDLSYRILAKSGETLTVWERGSFEPGTGNLIGIIFDQTEQKSYERLLDESQTVAKLGNWSFILQTQEIKWSNQMYQLFPEDRESGPPSFEKHKSTVHPDDQSHWSETVTACAQGGTSYKMRFRVVHPDKTLWIEALGNANRNAFGEIVSLSGTCQDVTETVKIEETLNTQRIKNIQTTRLASLGEMSAGVAHEINNPLAIISGNTQLLIQDLTDSEKTLKKLNGIAKASDRISKIVYGLKKFSRMSDRTERKACLLNDIVQETLYILESKAQHQYVKLTIENKSESLVYCNQLEIEQVIINLVSNSLDAVKPLKEKWINIQIFDQSNLVVLQVHDSGSGVNLEIERKVFDPFFTTKNVGEGTGLGLSITKGILDEHSAEISLNKSFGHTCFEIKFPVYNEPEKYAI